MHIQTLTLAAVSRGLHGGVPHMADWSKNLTFKKFYYNGVLLIDVIQPLCCDTRERADVPANEDRPFFNRDGSNTNGGRKSQETCRLHKDQLRDKCSFNACKFAHRCRN